VCVCVCVCVCVYVQFFVRGEIADAVFSQVRRSTLVSVSATVVSVAEDSSPQGPAEGEEPVKEHFTIQNTVKLFARDVKLVARSESARYAESYGVEQSNTGTGEDQHSVQSGQAT
jgi:hypothetical protein